MNPSPSVTFARRPHDWRAVEHLVEQYHQWLCENIVTPVPEQMWKDLESERLRIEDSFSPPHLMALAWLGPVPVGILGARVHGQCAELTRFFVRPIARGCGVAPMLLTSMLDRLAALAVSEVELVTSPTEMHAAVRLYERFGFAPTGASTASIAHVHMAKRLDDRETVPARP